jgi:dienelactone hydrolase
MLPPAEQLPARPELPDPLVTLEGRRIETRDQWVSEQRPELIRLFQHYMYGTAPPAPDRIDVTVEREVPIFDGKATLREVAIRFGGEGVAPLDLLLVIPRQPRPAPVFLGMNFSGNHAAVADPGVRLPRGWMPSRYPGVENNRATDAGRGIQATVWNAETIVDRGYALAVYYSGDIQPDDPNVPGVRAVYPESAEERARYDWGTIAAWAWGFQRAVDYLRDDRDIDRDRIAVVGHSRNGKAALLAAAFDERIALAIPNQAGCGGTAPSRGTVGESVKQINDRFPHWFNGEFKKFNDRPELLPFDQHALTALMAPRPVLFTNAEEDTWANPAGQFEVLKAAEPIYRLLGAGGLETSEMPPLRQLSAGTLGYFIRPGEHAMGAEDWAAYLDYADRHLRPR